MITGASGFLGSHLCRRLHNTGTEVHCVSRNAPLATEKGFHLWPADLTDLDSVRTLFKMIKPDMVFHLSAHVTAAPDAGLVHTTFESILTSTVNLLIIANEIGCKRIILTGSLTEPLRGNPEAAPGSPYAAAKWASNAYARMFHALYGTPVVIVRPFMTFGPGQNKSKIVPYVTLCLLKEEVPQLSSGQWEADWIYVDDVIDGMLAAAQVPGVEGHSFDLGSGTLTSIRSVVEQLVSLTNSRISPSFSSLPDRPAEQKRVADTVQAYEKLGWKSTTSLERGLEKTIEWFRRELSSSSAS
jgi:UDP-glucose 4-epimerase